MSKLGKKLIDAASNAADEQKAINEIEAVNAALIAGHPPFSDDPKIRTAMQVAADDLGADRRRFLPRVGSPGTHGQWHEKYGLSPHWQFFSEAAPSPDTFGRLIIPTLPDTVLVIPDLQAPFHHPDALPFLSAVANKYSPSSVVGIGDEVDMQFLSRFDKFPELDEPKRELDKGIEFLGELFDLFPRAHGLTSNHVHGRLQSARRIGRLPPQMLVSWKELVGAPAGWEWYEEVHLGSVLFRHGDKWGKLSSSHLQRDIPRNYGKHMSVVHGHLHEQHGRVGDSILVGDDEYWAAYSGALIDVRSKAFDYVKSPKTRLGCLVIVHGTPHRIPLRRDANGRWTGVL